jgi:steroid 5-alpha reductase family enzyme
VSSVSNTAIHLLNLAVVFALTTALWALSVAVRDTSIVDIFWGTGFVVIAWVTYAVADGSPARQLLLATLMTIWGLRLTIHLARRNLGKGEDFRYRRMREHHGDRWPRRSLWSVFWLQGVLMWIVSLPVQAGQLDVSPHGLVWLDGLGIAVFAVGLFFETVGDAQLARFKADPANRGQVMDRGLWSWTRHPNYFGDFSVWWGLYLVALATGSAWWTVLGPLVMSVLLIRVSGAALLEKSIGKRRPGYAEYVRRTSGFFPRPPRR